MDSVDQLFGAFGGGLGAMKTAATATVTVEASPEDDSFVEVCGWAVLGFAAFNTFKRIGLLYCGG